MLYPLISSTMAQCVMKLKCSCSISVSLQTTCLAVITPLQRLYLSKVFPGLRYLCKDVFAEILQKNNGNYLGFVFSACIIHVYLCSLRMYLRTNQLKKQSNDDRIFVFVDNDNEDVEFPAEHVILDDFDYALIGLGRKKKQTISNKFTLNLISSRDESLK